MPPSSDVRALAESLAAGDDYLTFLDVLPLQRMAQSLIHMPRPTLDAIIELHDQPQLTLGAKEVLADLLRSYHARASHERDLGRKPLRLGQHNSTVRTGVGDALLVVLMRERGQQWRLQQRPLAGSSGSVEVHELQGAKATEQRLQLTGHSPGLIQWDAQISATGTPHPVTPWHGSRKMPAPKSRRTPQDFRLIIVVEER